MNDLAVPAPATRGRKAGRVGLPTLTRRALGALVGISTALVLPATPPAVAAAYPTAVVAWGRDNAGQATVPDGLSGVTAIAAGAAHSLALKSDGTVVAWGSNADGEATVPTGLSGVTAIAAGASHSLALKSDGTVVAWGNDYWGQVSVPPQLNGVTAIAAGGYHSLAVKSDRTVVAWGSEIHGQSPAPAWLSGVTAVAGGDFHSLALRTDGSVVAWGDNGYGESTVPTELRGVTAIAAGAAYNLALESDGTVVAWGHELRAQVPTGLAGVTAIAAGVSHSLALKSDGTVVAWGNNADGRTTVPTGLSGVTAIAAGGHHSLAVESLPPALTLNPTSIDFGGQPIGTSSASRPVQVRNTGRSPLTVASIGAAGDFATSGTCRPGTSVAVGGSCTIDVTFSPTALGPRSGTLTINHDGPNSPHLVRLAGTGVIEADLGLSMAASPNPVRTGTDLTYLITVSNAGPTAASDVTVIDAVPANTQFRSISAGSAWSCTTPAVGTAGTVRCRAATLAIGSQTTIQLVVKVVASGGNAVSNTATVTSPWSDPDTSDNSATVATSTFGRR